MSVCVVGGGAWGTALAQVLASDGTDVLIWAREPELVAEINTAHANSLFLPSAQLSQTIRATGELAELAALPALLAAGAEAFGFRGEVWTTKRVAAVIAVRFGVRYHPAHISRLLRAIGWSPQQPIQRATQRDAAAIAQWYAERWPALKRGLTRRDVPSSG